MTLQYMKENGWLDSTLIEINLLLDELTQDDVDALFDRKMVPVRDDQNNKYWISLLYAEDLNNLKESDIRIIPR